MTENKEQKVESGSLMLEMEMSDTSMEESKFITYRQNFAEVTPESLSNVASLFKISRAREWSSTVWEMANVLVTEKSGKQFAKPLKEAIRFASEDIYSKFELKFPSLQVIFTDGFRTYEMIVPVSAKLGILDSWMRTLQTEQIWFKRSLQSGNLLYYEVPVTVPKALRQLSMNQILFDLYGPNPVYIYVRSKIANPITKLFGTQEAELVKNITTQSHKLMKYEQGMKAIFAQELRSNLPKCVRVDEHHDPTMSFDKNGAIISWNIR